MFRRGTVAAQAPAIKAGLESRLVILRLRAERSAYGIAWISAALGCSVAGYFTYYFSIIFYLALSSTPAVSESAAVIVAVMLLDTALCAGGAVGAWYLARWAARRLIARYHTQTWFELHETNFMAMAVDDVYAQVIIERIDSVWSLRWISPPPPKTLEQQLEFAACYQLALRRMLGGVGRLDNGPLWQGGMAWYAGIGKGVACGCLAMLLLSWLGLAVAVVGAIFHLQRSGALIAYCDFLLYDERMAQAAREGRLTQVTSSADAHRPPLRPSQRTVADIHRGLDYDDAPERNEEGL